MPALVAHVKQCSAEGLGFAWVDHQLAVLAPHDLPDTTGSLLIRRVIMLFRPPLTADFADMTPGEVAVVTLDRSCPVVWKAWQTLPLPGRPHLAGGQPERRLFEPLTWRLSTATSPKPMTYSLAANRHGGLPLSSPASMGATGIGWIGSFWPVRWPHRLTGGSAQARAQATLGGP